MFDATMLIDFLFAEGRAGWDGVKHELNIFEIDLCFNMFLQFKYLTS